MPKLNFDIIDDCYDKISNLVDSRIDESFHMTQETAEFMIKKYIEEAIIKHGISK